MIGKSLCYQKVQYCQQWGYSWPSMVPVLG